jgi:hypothetical protein
MINIRSFFRKPETDQQKADRLFRIDMHHRFKDKINDQIKVEEVVVLDHKNKNLGSMSVKEGIKLAKDAGFDLVELNVNRENPPVCKFANSDYYTLRKPPIFFSWLSGIVSFCFLFYPSIIIEQQFRGGGSREETFVGMSVFLIVLFLSFRVGRMVYTGKIGCRFSKEGNIDFMLCLLGFAIYGALSVFLEVFNWLP